MVLDAQNKCNLVLGPLAFDFILLYICSLLLEGKECSHFSLHHYVILPFMESVGHVLGEIKQSSCCC